MSNRRAVLTQPWFACPHSHRASVTAHPAAFVPFPPQSLLWHFCSPLLSPSQKQLQPHPSRCTIPRFVSKLTMGTAPYPNPCGQLQSLLPSPPPLWSCQTLCAAWFTAARAATGPSGAWHQTRPFASPGHDTPSIPSAGEQLQSDIPSHSPTLVRLRLPQQHPSNPLVVVNIPTLSKPYRRKEGQTEAQGADLAGVSREHHPKDQLETPALLSLWLALAAPAHMG